MLQSSLQLYRNAYSGITRKIWWLSLVTLINRSGTMVLPFMSVYLREEMNFSYVQAGLIIACFGGGAMLGAFLGGKLTDKTGFYEVQFWSLFLNGILFIILGEMKSFSSLALCMFLTSSVGEAFRPANSAAIAFYSLPQNRTRSYSLNRLAINLGWSVGPAIGGILAALNYKYIFWFDGATCIMAALLMRLLLPPVTPVHQDAAAIEEKKKIHAVWKDTPYLRFMFFVFLTALCFMQLFSTLPLFYTEVFEFNKVSIGLIMASNGMIIALVEMILVYKLETKRNPLRYISAGVLLIGLSYPVLGIPAAPLLVTFTGMLMVTAGEMLMFPFVNSYWISRSTEHNRGQYAAVYTMSFSLAQVLAAPIGTQVVEHAGYNWLWGLVALICIIASFGFRSLIHERKQSYHDPIS